MYILKVRNHFDAAHFLRGYQGPCANTHGHSFKYEVDILGNELDSIGMLADFTEVKKKLKEIVESKLDHALLNDVEPFDKINPTAENLSKVIYTLLKYRTDFNIISVAVWESDDCGVVYTEE